MSSIADTAVVIQSSAQSVPSTPSWFGEPHAWGACPEARFRGHADGTLRCPAGHPLTAQERRNERGGYRADRVCGQHCSLSSLPTARSLPRLRCQNLEAAPGECHSPSVDLTRSLDRDHSSSHRNCTTPVARLEPMPDATRVDAAFAQPTC